MIVMANPDDSASLDMQVDGVSCGVATGSGLYDCDLTGSRFELFGSTTHGFCELRLFSQRTIAQYGISTVNGARPNGGNARFLGHHTTRVNTWPPTTAETFSSS